MEANANAAVEAVYRADWGQIVATLIRLTGDFDMAEQAAPEAFASAPQAWPTAGAPASPRAWIIQTARHKAIDRLRRRTLHQEKIKDYASRLPQTSDESVGGDSSEIPDDR